MQETLSVLCSDSRCSTSESRREPAALLSTAIQARETASTEVALQAQGPGCTSKPNVSSPLCHSNTKVWLSFSRATENLSHDTLAMDGKYNDES